MLIRVYGIDFTSSPSVRKPLCCSVCDFDGAVLVFRDLLCWESFCFFEDFLVSAGDWICGIDCPFGQSVTFLDRIGWGRRWSDYAGYVGGLCWEEYRDILNDYKRFRARGDKEHKRETDRRTSSASPQNLVHPPIGRMFFECVPRLLRAGVSLPELHRGDERRVVIEAYPRQVVRALDVRDPKYKDESAKDGIFYDVRRSLLKEVNEGDRVREIYGFRVSAPYCLADDHKGDHLDSLFCSIQAAWAYLHRHDGYGAPRDDGSLHRIENWIADPTIRDR